MLAEWVLNIANQIWRKIHLLIRLGTSEDWDTINFVEQSRMKHLITRLLEELHMKECRQTRRLYTDQWTVAAQHTHPTEGGFWRRPNRADWSNNNNK